MSSGLVMNDINSLNDVKLICARQYARQVTHYHTLEAIALAYVRIFLSQMLLIVMADLTQ